MTPEAVVETRSPPRPHRARRRPSARRNSAKKIAKLPVRMASRQTKKIARDEDIPREENFKGYQFPMLELLEGSRERTSRPRSSVARAPTGRGCSRRRCRPTASTARSSASSPGRRSRSTRCSWRPGTKVAKVNAIVSDLARSLSGPEHPHRAQHEAGQDHDRHRGAERGTREGPPQGAHVAAATPTA